MLIVHTTFPTSEGAEALARQLIENRLAACVHVGAPLRACYRWQGGIEAAVEVPLVIKTARNRYAALEHYLRAHHPYEVPEIVAIPVTEALPAYYDWVIRESTPPGEGSLLA